MEERVADGEGEVVEVAPAVVGSEEDEKLAVAVAAVVVHCKSDSEDCSRG